MPVVVIAGVAGFIGSHLSKYLFQEGWSVIGIDRKEINPETRHSLSHYYTLNILKDDLGDPLLHHMPDVLINCSGRASVSDSLQNPLLDYSDGTRVAFEILNALRKSAPKCRYVFLSSAAVYGNPSKLPITEAAEISPISPYGYHKWQGEIIAREFNHLYSIPTACVRIFSAYGVDLNRQVVWDIFRKSLTNDTLELQGTGLESRDFINVLDICRAIEIVALSAPMQGDIYNLGSGIETTIHILAELILKVLGKNNKLFFNGKLPEGVPLRWQADISRLLKLGYSSQVQLEDGLQEIAAWFNSNLHESIQ